MADGNWAEAIRRWEQLLDRFGPSSSWSAYRGLIVSYTELGRLGTAGAIAARGREMFPESVELASLWAGLPMFDEEWAASVERWVEVLEQYGPTASWKPYRGLANCYEQIGDIPASVEAAELGYQHFPDIVEMATTWAQMSMIEEDWPEAVNRFQHVLDRFGSQVQWKAHLRLALAHGRQGDLEAAGKTLAIGLERYSYELTLVGHAAELAMARRDWPEAVSIWNDILEARIRLSNGQVNKTVFPRRGSEWPWYEEAWEALISDWPSIEQELSFQPSPMLYRSLGASFESADLPEAALEILRHGAKAHPDDHSIAFDLAAAYLDLRHDEGKPAIASELGVDLEGHPLMSRICVGGSGLANDPISALCARNEETLDGFRPARSELSTELGSVHILRVPYDSSIELQIKAGRYLTPKGIEKRVRQISERDAWDEMTAPENLVLKRAREVSAEYARRFADRPLLEADALGEAVLFFVFHELCLYEPMKRLAEDIAAQDDSSPVFIEGPTDTYRYIDGYSFSDFDVLYLYFELRRRGVNAFLCRYHHGDPPSKPKLRFVPGVRSLLPRGEVQRTSDSTNPRVLVPAGIRSVRRVVGALGQTLVYSSGSVVKEFAYDRSLRQQFPIEPQASFHPSLTQLPEFRFDLWPAAVLHGVPLHPADGLEPTARIEVSAELGGDWLTWLDRALHDYLSGLSARAFAQVAAREIEEVHVCDHLFTDAVLFANAVKANGGRVVLWPHSANPVHVNERRAESFDEVHAVTQAGCEQWRKRFPEMKVTHSPSVMLDPPTRNTRVDESLPLSVVIIGGRSVLRHMPILDRDLHEKSYRDLFAGLEKLKKKHSLNVFFKPRGHTGEHEMWLAQLIGSSDQWERVLEHPLRMDLPNMLFVSVSMGSSALLEGLSRGIPGLVVRDFPVRDYTTLDADTFPTGRVGEMLDTIAACCRPGGYEALLEHELKYYATELEVGEAL